MKTTIMTGCLLVGCLLVGCLLTSISVNAGVLTVTEIENDPEIQVVVKHAKAVGCMCELSGHDILVSADDSFIAQIRCKYKGQLDDIPDRRIIVQGYHHSHVVVLEITIKYEQAE